MLLFCVISIYLLTDVWNATDRRLKRTPQTYKTKATIFSCFIYTPNMSYRLIKQAVGAVYSFLSYFQPNLKKDI